MKVKLMAIYTLTAPSLPAEGNISQTRLSFEESNDIKNSLAVTDGREIYGYVTGSEAALIKSFISRGMEVFCTYSGKIEEEETDRHTIKVYYIVKRI